MILTDIEARIVEALKEQQRTINATAKALGLSDDRTRRAFRRLAEMGVIEQQVRRGPWTVMIDSYEIGVGAVAQESEPIGSEGETEPMKLEGEKQKEEPKPRTKLSAWLDEDDWREGNRAIHTVP